MDSLRCMNCDQEVSGGEAKVFATVFVCSKCHDTAERLYRRSEGELRMLLLMLKESIRVALLEKRLHVGESGKVEDVSKTDLLRMMVRLEEQRAARASASR